MTSLKITEFYNQEAVIPILKALKDNNLKEKNWTFTGDRFNEGKPRWSLVHYESLVPMIRVLEYGSKKYSRENWKKGLDLKEILESMQRHLAALMDGEEVDSESGIEHMGHIQCNALFYNYHSKKLKDEQSNEK